MHKLYRLFNLGFLLAAIFGFTAQNSIAQNGCTAPEACNYDQTATTDDGSCLYIGFPCDDGDAQTVDFINGDCICTGYIEGCTAAEACNFNPLAMQEDFSCYFAGDNCDDGNDNTINDSYTIDCVCAGIYSGCTDATACNYDIAADVDNGNCEFPGNTCDDGDVFTTNDVYTADCVCAGDAPADVLGCTATEACNYNSAATVDDGSCELPGYTCDDANNLTFNDVLGIDCICAGQLAGCTLNTACNFNPDASIEDGSCLNPGDSCDDGDPITSNDMFTADCICAGDLPADILGCTAIEACNYNPDATVEDSSCLFPGSPCDDNDPTTENDLYNLDCTCSGSLVGCTDVGACNYNALASFDDGSCYFPGDACDDGVAETIGDTYDMDCVCFGLVPDVLGCTAMEACNFNIEATVDDGSCEFPAYPCNDGNDLTTDDVWSADCICAGLLNGCTDMMACNYDAAAAIDDFSCIFPGDSCDDNDLTTDNDMYGTDCVCAGQDNGLIAGCTEATACNYNMAATINDGSCLFAGASCEDGDANTFNDVIQIDCTCLGETQQFISGCTAIEACNYNAEATIDDLSCVFPGEPCDDNDANTTNDVLGVDCTCTGELLGCSTAGACNFNPEAVIDNGSCYFPGDACDDDYIYSINDAYNADCICVGDTITGVAGCTATEACNYNPEATIEDLSCVFPGEPCDDNDATTTNDVLGVDCVCAGETFGCTVADACNYNSSAIIDDNSCIFPGDACDDNNLSTDSDVYGTDCVCLGQDNGLIPGCMTPNACNYDSAATIDDDSCIIINDSCDDGDMFTFNDIIGADCICAGEPTVVIEGCTAIEACNYNPEATFEDGSCELPGYPCDDNDPNTMGDALGLDCVCSGMIVGCMDMTACNYNAFAAIEDGSCLFPGSSCDDGNAGTSNDVYGADCICAGELIQVVGCTNADACNYDAAANTDDGSCYFVGDTCDDGNANTSNDVYTANCECQGVVSVEEITALFSVYPNPTNGAITVTQRQGASIQLIEVMDMTGKRVVTFNPNTSIYSIDLSTFAQGLYTFNIRSNNEMKSVRVQKN